MKLSILTIADYAAVRPDATLDIVRGGQALFVLPEGAETMRRAIAFQLFLNYGEMTRSEWPVAITVYDSDGEAVGGAELTMPSPGSVGPDGDGASDPLDRYPAPGVIDTELAIPGDGEFKLTLSVGGVVLGEQRFTVVHIPDRTAEPLPDEVLAAVHSLAGS
jgi:hypothetical protein